MELGFFFNIDLEDILDDIEDEEIEEQFLFETKDYSKSLKRRTDWKKAIRKAKIYKRMYFLEDNEMRPLHWYSKNKIHCSCPMCSNKRKHGYISIGERKNIDTMDYRIAELSFIEEDV